jgi:hypothetical protein
VDESRTGAVAFVAFVTLKSFNNMGTVDEFLQDDLDDEKTIEFIKNYLPQDLKEKFSDDELYYFLDVIDEYYVESGILDAQPDKDGYIDIDLEKIVDYIIKEARKDEMGEYDPEELLFVVQGEMEYTDSLGGNE